MRRIVELNDILTVKDIEKFLDIGRGKAYDLVHSKQFHVVRVGSRILIPKRSFLSWLKGPY
ncbi:helix-turn-helix domain-containing protein [Halalkalibacter nanhaiisediminis]|uniref:Excisionase family DNA binding protein n=1 Tax=Halalkalibacter nanhaiisediminis TaxID=688079 RepID=A0A562QRG9_9BACI|nr:helix-turn-helix domain-containing protein [Halalkalibacter nanhaiisediminis]TWI59295.1 excisionase family DNA binding protein [Halalkalibacter nanhaiisediminis]